MGLGRSTVASVRYNPMCVWSEHFSEPDFRLFKFYSVFISKSHPRYFLIIILIKKCYEYVQRKFIWMCVFKSIKYISYALLYFSQYILFSDIIL